MTYDLRLLFIPSMKSARYRAARYRGYCVLTGNGFRCIVHNHSRHIAMYKGALLFL